jgi:hypothetical protein
LSATQFNIYANGEQSVSDAQSDSEDETDREKVAIFERAFRALFPAIQGMEKFTSFHHYPRLILHPIAVYRDLAVKGGC